EIDEAGWQAARLVRVVVEIVDLVDERRQRLLRAHVALAARRAFRDREDLALGLLDEIARGLAFLVPDRARDLAAYRHQRTQQRPLLDDVRIGARIGGPRRVARQRAEVREAAGLGELAQALQVLR